jgi:hypothetical protein
MKVYKVVRNYGTVLAIDVVLAENEEEVYRYMQWEKEDKPALEIKEEKRTKGCILSVAVTSGFSARPGQREALTLHKLAEEIIEQ